MRKILLTLSALLIMLGINAQSFEWGTATWNINDGRVYSGIEELQTEGIVLTYSNPNEYTLTFLNVIEVSYNLFIDDAAEPVQAVATAQGSTDVIFNYDFVEGHKYKIVTTGAKLSAVNLATFSAETVSENNDSYSVSFTVEGPELVKTINVEAYMSLNIIDQNSELTYSLIDTTAVLNALGAQSTSELTIYGLNGNGSYNAYFNEIWYDGWRDADGEYTKYNGGWDNVAGHNAYPAVYSIKINNTADSVFYYFYDYWKVYDENSSDSIGGSTIGGSRTDESFSRRAPETSYHNVIWEWDNGDGTTTKYTRSYRVDEGKDYKASFALIFNKKFAIVNATLHFISQENHTAGIETAKACNEVVGTYNANGTSMGKAIRKGLNIIRYADGTVRKVMVK